MKTPTLGICSTEDCDRPYHARGLCVTHYGHWLKEHPLALRPPPLRKTVEQRLRHYSLPMDGHLIWCAKLDKDGYGHLKVDGEDLRAARLALESAYGPIPDGMQALHLCDVPACIRLQHLYVGTLSDNVQDAVRAGNHRNTRKTHCPASHAYDEENTGVDPRGRRYCRACNRMKAKARYRREHPFCQPYTPRYSTNPTRCYAPSKNPAAGEGEGGTSE